MPLLRHCASPAVADDRALEAGTKRISDEWARVHVAKDEEDINHELSHALDASWPMQSCEGKHGAYWELELDGL